MSSSIILPLEYDYDIVIDEYEIPPVQDVRSNLSEVDYIISSSHQSRLKN